MASNSPTGSPLPQPLAESSPSPARRSRQKRTGGGGDGPGQPNSQSDSVVVESADIVGQHDPSKRRRVEDGSVGDILGEGMEEAYEGEDDTSLQTIAVGDTEGSERAGGAERLLSGLVELSEADLYHLLNCSEPPKRWDLIPAEDQLTIKKTTEDFLLTATYKDEGNTIGISRSYLYYLYRVCVPRSYFDHGNYMTRIKFNHIVTQIYGKQKTSGDKEKRSRRTITKELDLPLLFPSLEIELISLYRERIPYYPQISLRPQFAQIARTIVNMEAFKNKVLEEIMNRTKESSETSTTLVDGATQAAPSTPSSSSTSSQHHYRQPKEQPWYSIWEVPARNKICVLFQCPLIDPTQLKFSFISETEITVFLAEDASTVFGRFQPNDTHRFIGGVEQWPLPFSSSRIRTIRLPFAIEEPREDNFVFAQHGGVVLSLQRKRIGQAARVVTPKVGDWSEFEI